MKTDKKDKKAGVRYPIIEKRKRKDLKHLKEEAKEIAKAFEDKDWHEIKSSDSWAIFKIMSEFVDGFDRHKSSAPNSD